MSSKFARAAVIAVAAAACSASPPGESTQAQEIAACADRGTFDATKLPARNPAYARVPVTGSRLARNAYGLGTPSISSFATEIERAPLGVWGTTYRRSMLNGLGIANYRALTFGAALTPMATPSFLGPFAGQMIHPPSAIRGAYGQASPAGGVQLRTIAEYVEAYRRAARGQAGGMPVTDVADELIRYADADMVDLDTRNILIWRGADAARVRAAAAAAEQRYQNEAAGQQPGPRALEGVFVAVKDQIDVATIPTNVGTRWRNTVPAADAAVIANLRAHGAIVLAKSNMTEIGGNITGYNPHWGPVRNAYDQTKVGGGSSGGSAVAVATGLVPVAVGSDAGGSIRIPAAGNGVYGLKPTYGRMSQAGVYPLAESLSQPGPMANTPGDLAALYIAMAGAPHDCKFGAPGLGLGIDLGNYHGPGKKLQLGVYEGWNSQAAPNIRTKVGDAITRLVALGAQQRRIDPVGSGIPKLEWALVSQLVTYATSARATVTADAAYNANLATAEQRITVAMGQTVATNVANPTHLSSCNFVAGQVPCDVQRAQLVRRELKDALDKIFCDAGVDVIATFTIGQPMPPVRDALNTPSGGPASPDGETHLPEMEGIGLTNGVANLTGHPAITIPVGYVGGMPVGLQLIGREWSECDLMNIAQVYDRFTRERPEVTYDPLTPAPGGCETCAADGDCQVATCAADGSCQTWDLPDGAPCPDGVCSSGTCVAACTALCDDGNECTEETCDGASCSVLALPTGTPCLYDSGACDGSGTCVPFACSIGCDDGNSCTDDSCTANGCIAWPRFNGTPCPGGMCFEAVCTGGPGPDAGMPDAGAPDASTPDAGMPDAGMPDASTPDASMPDAGIPDAAIPDAGIPDAGIPDAGWMPDAWIIIGAARDRPDPAIERSILYQPGS